MCLGSPTPPNSPARILPRPTATAPGAAGVALTTLTATPTVVAATPPPPAITTLLGTPEPEPRSQADRLFAPDPAPTAKGRPSTAAATPGVDRRQDATRDPKVAQQTLTTSGVTRDAADILFGADSGRGTVQQQAANKNTRIAQGEALFDSPVRQPASAPTNSTATDIAAAKRRASERLEDDPAQPGTEEISDSRFVLIPPSDTDPQKIEVDLRRKIRSFQEEGGTFGASQAKHFLDGNGKGRRFTREEARSLEPIGDAEEVNQKRFVRSLLDDPVPARPEIIQPDGGPGSPGRTGFRNRLVNLTSPIQFDDHWTRKFDVQGAIMDDDFNFILGSGRGQLQSGGKFSAHREGGTVIVTGVVTHIWEDKYNFNKNDSPPGLSHRGWILQQSGRGKVFPFGATWRQRMTVRIEFENGKPFISEVIWDDL